VKIWINCQLHGWKLESDSSRILKFEKFPGPKPYPDSKILEQERSRSLKSDSRHLWSVVDTSPSGGFCVGPYRIEVFRSSVNEQRKNTSGDKKKQELVFSWRNFSAISIK